MTTPTTNAKHEILNAVDGKLTMILEERGYSMEERIAKHNLVLKQVKRVYKTMGYECSTRPLTLADFQS